MYIAMAIGGASLFSIILMMLLKARELRTEKPSILRVVGSGTDHTFRSMYRKVRKFFSYCNRRTAIALAQWIAYHILNSGKALLSWLHDLAHLHPHTKKVIDMVKGKEDISQRGSASIYLKRLTEESKDGSVGAIEDTMHGVVDTTEDSTIDKK